MARCTMKPDRLLDVAMRLRRHSALARSYPTVPEDAASQTVLVALAKAVRGTVTQQNSIPAGLDWSNVAWVRKQWQEHVRVTEVLDAVAPILMGGQLRASRVRLKSWQFSHGNRAGVDGPPAHNRVRPKLDI